MALIWNVSEFITLYVNRKGIHPGAHITLDFLLWGALSGSGITDFLTWLSPEEGITLNDLYLGCVAGSMEIIAAYVSHGNC